MFYEEMRRTVPEQAGAVQAGVASVLLDFGCGYQSAPAQGLRLPLGLGQSCCSGEVFCSALKGWRDL